MMSKLNLCVLAITGTVMGITSVGQADNAPVGSTKKSTGTVVLLRTDGVQQRVPSKATVPLYEGDVVKTESGSLALIEFVDGVEVALNENTSFKVLHRWERDKPNVRIIRMKEGGEIWAKTAGGPKRFEVETPVATAAVKETEFNLKVQEDGETILTVVEGVVQFGTAFGTCPIRTDTISYGVRGKKCTKPASTDAKAATNWSKELRSGQ